MRTWIPVGMALCLSPGLALARQAPDAPGARAARRADAPHAPTAEAPRELLRVLAPPAQGAAPTARTMVAAVVELGPGVVPALCGLLTGEIVPPELAFGTADQPIHPRAIELREEVLRQALRSFQPELVAAHLAPRASEAELGTALACIRLLGSTPCSAAFDGIVDAAARIEPIHLVRAYVRTSLEVALSEQLARDPRLASTLTRHLFSVPPELLPVFAAAAARAPHRESVELLGQMLGRSGEVDRVVVPALAACTQGVDLDLEHPVRARLRATLRSPDPLSRRAAAAALGKLLDTASVRDLIELVEDDDPRVAGSARAALAEICGTSRPSDRTAWLEWYAGEEAWRTEEAPAWIEALASEDPAQVHRALVALSTHPLYRHQLAEALGPVFRTGHPDSVKEALAIAVRLRSPRALAHLVELRDSSVGDRRAEAARAIATLTGRPYVERPKKERRTP